MYEIYAEMKPNKENLKGSNLVAVRCTTVQTSNLQLTYLLTYLFTSSLTHSLTHSMVQDIIEKLTVIQLVKKYPAFL